MAYYSIGQFAKMVGKTTQTLRNWDKSGMLKPHHVGYSGIRYYSDSELNKVLGRKSEETRRVIGYCRGVSDPNESKYVKEYMTARGYQYEIITDTCKSNEGLLMTLDNITDGSVEKLIIYSKCGFDNVCLMIVENLCMKFNTVVEIIDSTL